MRKHCRQLDAGVEASEPHDFAVRDLSALVKAQIASTASSPNVRDDRETPLGVGGDGDRYTSDLELLKIRKFSQRGLDMPFSDLPVGQSK
jgi:hypothetical protein